MLVHLWDVNVFLGYQGPGIFFRNKDSAVSNNTSTLLRFSGSDDGLSCTLTRTKLPSQPSPACQPGPKMPLQLCRVASGPRLPGELPSGLAHRGHWAQHTSLWLHFRKDHSNLYMAAASPAF